VFGILYAPGVGSPSPDRRVRELVRSTAKRAQRGRRYAQCSPPLARDLAGRLHVLGLHLPWCWKPGSYDLTLRLSRLDDERQLGFKYFYRQEIAMSAALEPLDAMVRLERPQATSLDPREPDPEVGRGAVIVEANATW